LFFFVLCTRCCQFLLIVFVLFFFVKKQSRETGNIGYTTRRKTNKNNPVKLAT
jgi:large-conductance mechanosensitive channel